jgi:hypothetical protein
MVKRATIALLTLTIACLSSCSKNDNVRANSVDREGKYVGNVLLNGNPYSMVVDLIKRTTANEYTFLFGNRQSVAIVNGNDFTIPLVQGAPSFMVSGNGSFLDSNKMRIYYKEVVNGPVSQIFEGTLKKL